MRTKVDVRVEARPDETICRLTCNGETILVIFHEDEVRVSRSSTDLIPPVPGLSSRPSLVEEI